MGIENQTNGYMVMDHSTWLQKVNAAVNSAVAACFCNSQIGGWNENHITTQVLDALQQVGTELAWTDQAQKIRWEGYKLTGVQETNFGDIALIVRVWLTSQEYIDGVAYYEAKRQFFNDKGAPVGFTSIDAAQLSRIGASTHASHLLLYDVDQPKGQVSITAVPTRFAEELAKGVLARASGRVMHRYGQQWIMALGNNFRGFGLDFSTAAVNAIRSMSKSVHAPFALLNVAIGMMNVPEPQLDQYCKSLENYQCSWGIASTPPAEDEIVSRTDGFLHP